MAVPAHDQRDFEFARRYGLDIVPVYTSDEADISNLQQAIPHGDYLINSGQFDGVPEDEAFEKIVAFAEAQGLGERTVTYRLRDWLISRQRYWGAPIPMIHCPDHGIVPVPEEDLPVLLPENVKFQPTGQSPLTQIEEWVNVPCPIDGRPARRETDTMDTFMCSSWYHMRYVDPHNPERPFSQELARKWLPVDQYTGGAEHAVMHLLYVRFFWKAVRDMGLVEGDEPMLRLFNQGVILGPDGNRMSKSRGNVVAPDEQVREHGADAFRCQLMFIGPWDQGGPYNPTGMAGIERWLRRIWSLALDPVNLSDEVPPGEVRALRRMTHKTIREVTQDFEDFAFNTLIARLMELSSAMQRARDAGPVQPLAWTEALEALLLMTAPLAPHITEEIWERIGRSHSIHTQPWPRFDPELARDEEVEVVVQVNGKIRDRLTLPAGAPEEDARAAAFASPRVQEVLNGKEPRRVIYIPEKLVNIVV